MEIVAWTAKALTDWIRIGHTGDTKTKPIEELHRIAVALQSVVADRANVELFQDPATHTTSLKVERDSEFAARVILTTSDIRQYPIKLVNMMSGDPEEVTCETTDDLDEALGGILALREVHELLNGIMTGK